MIVRSGTLQPGEARSLPFGLLGPGRRVTFTADVDGETAPGERGRLELRCAGRVVERLLASGQRSATIDQRRLGPDRNCEVVLRSTSPAPQRFTMRLRLAIERV